MWNIHKLLPTFWGVQRSLIDGQIQVICLVIGNSLPTDAWL